MRIQAPFIPRSEPGKLLPCTTLRLVSHGHRRSDASTPRAQVRDIFRCCLQDLRDGNTS